MEVAELNVTEDSKLLFDSSLYEKSTISRFENHSSTGSINDHFIREITVEDIAINFVVIPILAAIGLFGNTSTVVLFFLKGQKSASIIFIIGLATSDLIYILLRLIAHIYLLCELYFAKAIGNLKPNSFFWICLSQIFQQIGYIFVLVITIERISAVWFPLKHRNIWTTRRSRFISVVLVLLPLGNLVVVVDFLLFSLSERRTENDSDSTLNGGFRYINSQGSLLKTWSIIYRLIFETLPLPLVFIFNIVIMIGIRRASLSKRDWNSTMQEKSKKEAKITKMLLVISIMFVLLCGPFTVTGILISTGALKKDDIEMLIGLLHVLIMLNNVLNFIVYGVHDSSFRNKICKVCGCKK